MTSPYLPGLRDIFLQPGHYAVCDAGSRIRTVLGSCVSMTLWSPARAVGAMSHCLLPTRRRTSRAPQEHALDARYADEALRLMLQDLELRGVPAAQCCAKIFGGGDMFPSQKGNWNDSVGHRNGEAARELLSMHGIQVASEHLFGEGHRQVVFEVATGDVWVRQMSLIEIADGEAR